VVVKGHCAELATPTQDHDGPCIGGGIEDPKRMRMCHSTLLASGRGRPSPPGGGVTRSAPAPHTRSLRSIARGSAVRAVRDSLGLPQASPSHVPSPPPN